MGGDFEHRSFSLSVSEPAGFPTPPDCSFPSAAMIDSLFNLHLFLFCPNLISDFCSRLTGYLDLPEGTFGVSLQFYWLPDTAYIHKPDSPVFIRLLTLFLGIFFQIISPNVTLFSKQVCLHPSIHHLYIHLSIEIE